ncbi:MAG: DUF3313 family protein [Halieaceae bacterium]
MTTLNRFFLSLLLAAFTVVAAAETKPPEVSHDGLHLLKGTKLRLVYQAPGASLKEYDKIALLECYVAFKKNWQRDYNRDAIQLDRRINDRDMKRIRGEVAKEFTKEFTEVLSKEGGHEMVKAGGDGVLIIRPAIVNLEVTAPDTMSAGMGQTFATTAGQMTLYMELLDGKTGAILYRVIDPEVAGNEMGEIRNSVTNRAAADRVIRRWATVLNNHLASLK